jgi:GDPmannose 4,6-dehydratase
LAFHEAGIELEWQGEGENEKGICKATGKVLIEIDPNYYRPAEVDTLLGDPTKARTQLGWNPNQTSIEELVKIMMQHDLNYVVRFKDRDSLQKYE